MRDFNNLIVWQRAHRLTLDLYRATETFPKTETFGLRSQMRRSGASIPTNLAEGCGRWGDGEMGRFIQIAMGSASELDYLLRLATDLGYLQPSEHTKLNGELNEIRRMLTVFYKRVRGPEKRPVAQLANS